jgi:hypothetical protein
MTHEEQEFATLLLNVSVVLFVLLIEFVILRFYPKNAKMQQSR